MRQPVCVSRTERGYIILISVLIVGAIGLAVTTSLLLLGIGASRTNFALQQSNQAKALANACAEQGLLQIHNNNSFTGTGNLTLGGGTCVYTVTNTGGQTRSVVTIGTVGTIVRKVTVTTSAVTPAIITNSWQELP